MNTRKQMFEECNPMRVEYKDGSGVTFANFPASLSNDGKLGYDSGMLNVAEQVAQTIPQQFRPAVTVDFAKIPAWDMRETILAREVESPLPEEHVLGPASQTLLEIMNAPEAE